MPRFLVRYYSIKDREKVGCCNKPFDQGCSDCKNWCLHVTTAEATDAEAAIAQVKRFCSECDGFTAEPVGTKEPAKPESKTMGKKWSYLRKDD